MKFTQRVTVLGVRHFNDTIEGQKHDFTKVRVLMDVPENSKTESGKNVAEWPWGDHENYGKVKHLTFPIEADLTITATSKGFEVNEFKPIGAVKDITKEKAA